MFEALVFDGEYFVARQRQVSMYCSQENKFFGLCCLANGQDMWLANKSFQVLARTSSASDHDLLSENKLSLSCSLHCLRLPFCKLGGDVIKKALQVLHSGLLRGF